MKNTRFPNRRAVSLLLAIAFLLTTSSFGGTLADAEHTLTVETTAYIQPSETATVGLNITEGMDISMFQFALAYDADRLELASVTAGSVFGGTDSPTVNTTVPGMIYCSWDSVSRVLSSAGSILEMSFTAKADAGGLAAVCIDRTEDFVLCDANFQDIDVTVVQGGVRIKQDSSFAALKAAAAAGEDYALVSPVTLEEDLTLADMVLTIEDGGVLTVPEGKVLTLKASADTTPCAQVFIEAGGKLENNGRMVCGNASTVELNGLFENAGRALFDHATMTAPGGTMSGWPVYSCHGAVFGEGVNGAVIDSAATVEAEISEIGIGETLRMKLMMGEDDITDEVSSWLAKPAADSAPDGTESGSIDADGLFTGEEDGPAYIAAVVNGQETDNCMRVDVVYKAPVTDIEVSTEAEEFHVGASYLMCAAVTPGNAYNKTVAWTVEEDDGQASINADGLLTAIAAGAVTVRATAVDGSGVYGEKAIIIEGTAVTITGGDTVNAGKTLKLAGGFVPGNLTNTRIVWSLAPEDAAYASIAGSNLAATLTAKAVTEAHTVTVTAAALDGSAAEATWAVEILPLVSAVQVEQGGESVTGKTLTLDANIADETARQLTLDVSTLPDDAMQGAAYTVSPAGLLTVTPNEEGTQFVVDSTGVKLGTATLTFKAKDGSGKSAVVKVSVTKRSQGLEVTDTLGEGGKLVAGKRTQLTARFTGAAPSNKAVTWYMDEEYAGCATLSASGLLTAKAVTKEVTVKVKAIAKDGGCESAEHEVTVIPLVSNVYIKREGAYVTGATVPVDLNDTALRELTFGMERYPLDAQDGRSWTWSDTRNIYATYTDNGDGTLTVDGFTGKTGIVTLTAKATDGSRKSAVVKVQFVRLAQEVHIDAPRAELRGGESLQLTNDVTVNRSLTDKTLLWTLNEEALPYASISAAGRLTTKAVPEETAVTVTATVKANPGKSDSVEITLRPAVQQLDIYSGETLWTGTTQPVALGIAPFTLRADRLPADAIEGVTWKSSSAAIARIDASGVVTPLRAGTVSITATATDGSRKTATVKLVIGTLMEGLEITNPAGVDDVRAGKYVQLAATYTNTPTNRALAWSLEDPADAAYASVSATGRVTAKTVYEPHDVVVKVAAKDNGGASDTYTLHILPASDTVLNILDENEQVVTKQTLTYAPGTGTVRLSARTLGETEDEPVTWRSSSPTVASIDANGLVTLKRNGTVTVTATAADRRTATVTIKTVTMVDSITVRPRTGSAAVSAGKTLALTASVQPATATNKTVSWSVSGSNMVTVSAAGVLTAKAGLRSAETVTVTATAKDGSGKYDALEVTVYPLSQSLSITRDDRAIEGTTQVIDLNAPGTLTLAAKLYPANANQSVVWGPTNTRGAAYMTQDGTLHLMKAGTVTVTAKAMDGSGKTASFKLTVLAHATDISVRSRENTFTVRGGGRLTLQPDFETVIPTNQKVTWSLNAGDAPYATITASGILTAKAVTAQRTVTVTVTSLDDPTVFAEQEITVLPSTASVRILKDGANVSRGTLTLDLTNDETELSLTAQNLPRDARQDWIWTSSSKTVAAVDGSGTVTVQRDARGNYRTGTVTITAKAADGSGKSMTVKVAIVRRVSALTLTPATGTPTVKGGRTLAIRAALTPTNATLKTLTWSLRPQDLPYASVSAAGVVTAKRVTSPKTILLTCASKDGGAVETLEITVTP